MDMKTALAAKAAGGVLSTSEVMAKIARSPANEGRGDLRHDPHSNPERAVSLG